jgi:hypothetical protein
MGILVCVSTLIEALVPVDQLPPETLGTIPGYQEDRTPMGLVQLMSVRSYWRVTFFCHTLSLDEVRWENSGEDQSLDREVRSVTDSVRSGKLS